MSFRSKVPLARLVSKLDRWKIPVLLGEAGTAEVCVAAVASLCFGEVSSSSDAGLLREPGLSFSKAFLRDMVLRCPPRYQPD